MVKLGIVQTTSYKTNRHGITNVSRILESLGKKEVDVICLPEQWLQNNRILDFDDEFSDFKKIAKEFSMTIIPGAFYKKKSKKWFIASPVIGPTGDIIGEQEKIHPFGYEKKLIRSGTKTKIFNTKCKFGLVICYDMVFAEVAKSLTLKGADVLFSPSRIVKKGIAPWHQYTMVRALENRIPLLAANVKNQKFGGKSVIIDLFEKDGIIIPKKIELTNQSFKLLEFNLKKYKKARTERFRDRRNFF